MVLEASNQLADYGAGLGEGQEALRIDSVDENLRGILG